MNDSAMKYLLRISPLLIYLLSAFSSQGQKTYTLLYKNTGKLNYALISALPPALKGLAAFYSAIGGTDCMDQQCALTTALGLGNQGSANQKDLIKKYFPGDKVAALLIGQDCFQAPSSSASFSNFVFLQFTVEKDLIVVNYELDVLNHGNIKKIDGPDIYLFKNQTFTNKKRVLYAWADK
jgi:hypothetical protein